MRKGNVIYGYYFGREAIYIMEQDIRTGVVLCETKITGVEDARTISVDTEGNIYLLGSQDGNYTFWKINGGGQILYWKT